MSAAEIHSETIDQATVEQLMADARRYKAALEAVVAQASELTCRSPDTKNIPRNLLLGSILTLSGLAESALEG